MYLFAMVTVAGWLFVIWQFQIVELFHVVYQPVFVIASGYGSTVVFLLKLKMLCSLY